MQKLLHEMNLHLDSVLSDITGKGGMLIMDAIVEFQINLKRLIQINLEFNTQDGNDTQQLVPMMQSAQEAMQCKQISGVADTGYYNGEQLKQCDVQSMTVYVAMPEPPKGRQGRFGRAVFRYEADADVYVCPANEKLRRAGSCRKQGKFYLTYRSDTATCSRCEKAKQCLSKSAVTVVSNVENMRTWWSGIGSGWRTIRA